MTVQILVRFAFGAFVGVALYVALNLGVSFVNFIAGT